MGDLKNPKVIIIKGLLFLLLGTFAAGLLLTYTPNLTVAALLAIAIWSFCRFYYFTFYVIEHYVDSDFRFAGILHAMRYSLRRLFEQRSK